MALPAVLMAVGTGVQVFSQWMANIEQAKAEYENAKFYQEQSDVARFKMQRDLSIVEKEYEYRKGATIGAEIAGGVDVGSGSALNNIAAVTAAKIQELNAIKIQGDMEIKLARMRASRSSEAASTLESTRYNVTQATTTLLGNYTKSNGFGTDFSFFRKKEQNITGVPV